MLDGQVESQRQLANRKGIQLSPCTVFVLWHFRCTSVKTTALRTGFASASIFKFNPNYKLRASRSSILP